MNILLDLETKSEIDLTKTNPWVYSEHPSTDVIVLAYKIEGQDQVFTWFPGDPVPKEFKTNMLFIAHNVQFEYSIFANVLCKKYGFPETMLNLDRWIDTVPMCRCHGVPGNLEKATQMLQADETKMSEGKMLIRKFSKPKSVKDGVATWHETTKEEFDLFVDYCKQDVRATEFVYNTFKNSSNWQHEKPLIDLDLWQNMTGLPVDVKSCNMIIDKVAEATKKAEEKAAIFGVNPRSPKQILDWLSDNKNINLPDVRQDTINKRLQTETDKEVIELLTLRLFMSRSSVKKFEALQNRTDSTDHIRQWILYHGAHTGRWSGSGFQPHNMPRSKTSVKDIEVILKDFRNDKIDFWDIMNQAKKVLPGMIKAEKGKSFIIGDFAAIEARVLAWMAGQQKLIKIFQTTGKVYEDMAAKLYNCKSSDIGKDSKERQLGKTVILGCGYGIGFRKFTETCLSQGIKLNQGQAKKAVETYRSSYPEIPEFWNAAQTCFIKAVKNQGQEFKTNGCMLLAQPGRLTIELPSGRKLYYYKIQYSKRHNEWSHLDFRTNARKRIYGGLLVENIVQAVARDIMAHCMLELKYAGLSPLLHVHDEAVCYENKEEIKAKQKIFDKIMNTPPDWFKDFPLVTESEVCARYHK